MASRGINKVILIGNLGRDPEIRYTPSNSAVANISIATSESWRDKQSGENRERTEWHRVVFYDKLAEIAGQYLKKGSKVYIEGRLQTRKWQGQDGQERYTTEIIARDMQMLDSRGGSSANFDDNFGEEMDQGSYGERPPRPPQRSPQKQPATPEPSFDNDFDDDIPFARPAALDGLVFPYDGAWFGNGPTYPYQRK